MLFIPSGSLPPKKSTTGIARGRATSGHWLRAIGQNLNTRSPKQLLWRQIFQQAKRNWLSIGPGGANNTPIAGIAPQSLWQILSETYYGILLPGLLYAGLQLPATFIGCSTPEAFQVMVLTTLASLNLAIAGPPPATVAALSTSTGGSSASDGGWAFNCVIPTQPPPNPSTFDIAINATSPAGFLATPPGGNSIDGFTLSNNTNNIPLLQGQQFANSIGLYNGSPYSGPAITGTLAASGQPSGLTIDIVQPSGPWVNPAGFGSNATLTAIASPTLAAGTYTITLTASLNIGTLTNTLYVTVYETSAPPATLTLSALPSGITAATATPVLTGSTGPGPLALTVAWDTTLTVSPTAAPNTGTTDFTPAAGTATTTFPIALAVTAIQPTPITPAPIYNNPLYLDCSVQYDSSYIVQSFTLTYSVADLTNAVMRRFGAPLPNQWMVTASPAYTSGYAVPPAALWQLITPNGQVQTNDTISPAAYPPDADDILSAWIATYGPLPATGKISFLVQPVDPATGCPGPAVSTAVSWANGTLTGAIMGEEGIETPSGGPFWWGPCFFLAGISGPVPLVPGTPQSYTVGVSGDRGYKGTVTFSVKSRAPVPNGNNNTTYALPPGLTFTFAPPTLTVTDDFPTGYSSILTISADPAVAPFWGGNIAIEATDGIQFVSAAFELDVAGVIPLPPTNFLTVSPSNQQLNAPAGQTTPVALTLANTGPDPIAATLLTASTAPNCSAEFGQGGSAAATATPTAITFALATGAAANALVGQQLSSAGYAPAGYNLTDAPIIANTATTVTVASTNNPGTQTTQGIAILVNNNVTVPAANYEGPSPSNASWSGGNLVYTDPWASAPGSLVGLALWAQGYTPSGYNTADNAITANDGSTITLGSAPNPGSQTVEGTISITIPATVGIYMFLTPLPGNEVDISPLQIAASAGTNTAYAAAFVSTTATGPLTIAPATAPPVTVPFVETGNSFTLSNTGPDPVTLTLTVPAPSVVVPASLSSPTITVPGGTESSPGTNVFDAYITVNLGTSGFSGAVVFQASAPGILLTGTVPYAIP